MLGIMLIAGIAAVATGLAYRDHRRTVGRRRKLLDRCLDLLDNAQLSHGGDGFPVVVGERAGRSLHVLLFNDGMTIRRLPQLWLQITELRPMRIGAGGFAVLVRPSGYEFFSLTAEFHHIIEVPASFPRECIVRGESPLSEGLLRQVEPVLAGILADPAVKEFALTCKGARLIRQMDEGRRGDYLLLRQAAFDQSAVPIEVLTDAMQDLEAITVCAESRTAGSIGSAV